MHPQHRPIDPRYFTVTAPAPWSKSGTAKVTVRTGGPYAVYLCVGNNRVPMRQAQGWALLAALANALQASYGPMPGWASTAMDPFRHQRARRTSETFTPRDREES